VIRLIRAELFKLCKRKMTWTLLYIMMGIMFLVNLLLFAISQISLPSETLGGLADLASMLNLSYSIPFTFSILASFGAVMAVILMASSMGNEYNWRTIRIALISGEGRLKFLWAKLISVVILVVIGMAISLVVGFIMSMVTNAIGGHALDFGFLTSGYLWDQFVQFWRTLFIILPFIIMGLLFAVVGRSAMPGIAIGVGLLFLEPVITPFMSLAEGWVSNIPKYLFSANVNAITALNNLPGSSAGPLPFGGGTATNTSSLPQAFIVLGVYIVAFLVVAFYLFKKRDVTG
jgi:ABC-2 type transport system permease protein